MKEATIIGRVVDNKGNGTFKTRCDLCGVYTEERNYILSIRLDGAIGSPENTEAVMCKRCSHRLHNELKHGMEIII
jgi:hypothetical protein